MEISNEVLDELLKGCTKPEDVIGEQGLLKQLTKRLLERAMQGELTHHLGYEKHASAGRGTGNSRNGTTSKTVKGDFGEIVVETPRDRQGTFEPQILKKHQTRFDGFDDKILSLYARGMTVREIQGHLQEVYGVEVSPTLISDVTDAIIEELKIWQGRPLEPIYPIVYLDALYVKMRHEGRVENRAVYVAIGVTMEGQKEVLGLWTSAHEGAKFWLGILTELKNRGVREIFIVCVDGLKGFPQAIEAVFPHAIVQTCIVHMIRASLNYVSWKERKTMVKEIKPVYQAATEAEAERALEEFGERWGHKYQAMVKLWRDNWQRVVPFFDFPSEVRKVIYTTNAVESLNMSLRRAIKTRGSFPSEDAAMKLLFLALRRVSQKWNTVQSWREALNQFEVRWGDRIRAALAPAGN